MMPEDRDEATRPEIIGLAYAKGPRGWVRERRRLRWLNRSLRTVLLPQSELFGAFGRSFIVPPIKIAGSEYIFIGDDVQIFEGVWISIAHAFDDVTPRLQIGDRSTIGRFCQFSMCGEVIIEEDVGISDRVLIADTSHEPSHNLPWYESLLLRPQKVTIKKGAVVDVGAAILPGVTVGVGAYVRAGAVVTRDVPDHTAVAGFPARMVGQP
jgi:acetyltransferase-like isoleucine patch superfamily enzyme